MNEETHTLGAHTMWNGIPPGSLAPLAQNCRATEIKQGDSMMFTSTPETGCSLIFHEGGRHRYSPDCTRQFLENFDEGKNLKLFLRSHQPESSDAIVDHGVKYFHELPPADTNPVPFRGGATVFSAAKYRGTDNNAGSVILFDSTKKENGYYETAATAFSYKVAHKEAGNTSMIKQLELLFDPSGNLRVPPPDHKDSVLLGSVDTVSGGAELFNKIENMWTKKFDPSK